MIRSHVDYMPNTLEMLIQKLRAIVEKQKIETCAALHQIGSYKLVDVYKRYGVTNSKWNSMTETQREKTYWTFLTDKNKHGKNESFIEKIYPRKIAKKSWASRPKSMRTI